MPYRCPIPGCHAVLISLNGLRAHISQTHRTNGYCFICGKQYRDLKRHWFAKRYECELHGILWALTTRSNKNTREERNRFLDLAEKKLWIKPEDALTYVKRYDQKKRLLKLIQSKPL